MEQDSELSSYEQAMARIRSVMSASGLMSAEIIKATDTAKKEVADHEKDEKDIDQLSAELSQLLIELESCTDIQERRQAILDAMKKSQAIVKATRDSSVKIKKITQDLISKAEELAMKSMDLIEATDGVCKYLDSKSSFISSFYEFSKDRDKWMDDDSFKELGKIVNVEYKKYRKECNPCIWCFLCNRICHSKLNDKDIKRFQGTDIPVAVNLHIDTKRLKKIVKRIVEASPEGVSEEVIKGVGIRTPRLRDSIIYGQKGQTKHACCVREMENVEMKDSPQIKAADNPANIQAQQGSFAISQPERVAAVSEIRSADSILGHVEVQQGQIGQGFDTEKETDDCVYIGKRKDTIQKVAKVCAVINPEGPLENKEFVCEPRKKRHSLKIQLIDATEENGWMRCKQFKMMVVPPKRREKICLEGESQDEDNDNDDGENEGDDGSAGDEGHDGQDDVPEQNKENEKDKVERKSVAECDQLNSDEKQTAETMTSCSH